MRWLDSITDSMDMSLSELWKIVKEGQGSLGCCRPWGYRVRHKIESSHLSRGVVVEYIHLLLFGH